MGCCCPKADDKQDEKKESLINSSVDNSLKSLSQEHRKSAQELLSSWNLEQYYDILVTRDYLPIDKWEHLDQNTLMYELNFTPDDATNFIHEVSAYFEKKKTQAETKKMQEQLRKLTEQYDFKDNSIDTEELHHQDDISHGDISHDHSHNHNHKDSDTIANTDEKNVSQTMSFQQEDDFNSDDELHGNPNTKKKHTPEHEHEHSHSHDEHDLDDTPTGDDEIARQTTDNVVLEDTSDLQNMKEYMTYLRKTSNLEENIEKPLVDELNNNIQTEELVDDDVEDEQLHEHVDTRDLDLDESEDLATDEDM